MNLIKIPIANKAEEAQYWPILIVNPIIGATLVKTSFVVTPLFKCTIALFLAFFCEVELGNYWLLESFQGQSFVDIVCWCWSFLERGYCSWWKRSTTAEDSPGLLNCGGAAYSFAVSIDKQIAMLQSVRDSLSSQYCLLKMSLVPPPSKLALSHDCLSTESVQS